MRSSVLLYVLVIAHPDDESMFFVPTLENLKSSDPAILSSTAASTPTILVWLVCLTNGNYDGLGKIREQELERVVEDLFHDQIDQLLWLRPSKTAITEHDNEFVCEDHPRQSWDIPKVGQSLRATLDHAMNQLIWSRADTDIDGMKADVCEDSQVLIEQISLITFDEYGVSGHVNHRDTYRTVRWLLSNWKPLQNYPIQPQRTSDDQSLSPSPTALPDTSTAMIPVEAWQLQSEHNLVGKYFPILFWLQLWALWLCRLWGWLTGNVLRVEQTRSAIRGRRQLATSPTSTTTTVWTLTSLQPQLNYAAMASHASQFVWYRRLFVVFSCYTYRNVLLPLDPAGPTPVTFAKNDSDQGKKVS